MDDPFKNLDANVFHQILKQLSSVVFLARLNMTCRHTCNCARSYLSKMTEVNLNEKLIHTNFDQFVQFHQSHMRLAKRAFVSTMTKCPYSMTKLCIDELEATETVWPVVYVPQKCRSIKLPCSLSGMQVIGGRSVERLEIPKGMPDHVELVNFVEKWVCLESSRRSRSKSDKVSLCAAIRWFTRTFAKSMQYAEIMAEELHALTDSIQNGLPQEVGNVGISISGKAANCDGLAKMLEEQPRPIYVCVYRIEDSDGKNGIKEIIDDLSAKAQKKLKGLHLPYGVSLKEMALLLEAETCKCCQKLYGLCEP